MLKRTTEVRVRGGSELSFRLTDDRDFLGTLGRPAQE
jgi:hypothetical protein